MPASVSRDKYDSDVITDITEIPDVEEEAREGDLTTTVADAPNVRSNRVQALQELDQQILFQLPSAMVRPRDFRRHGERDASLRCACTHSLLYCFDVMLLVCAG